MKKLLILCVSVFAFGACQTASEQADKSKPANSSVAAEKSDGLPTVSSHSQNKGAEAPSAPKPDGASPMVKPVDVAEMTVAIDKAKTAYEKNTKDEAAVKTLAKAYFVRASALTEAAQYRAALGDFRKGLKLDPSDASAKKMHDEIIRIFESMGREAPKEGEEPPPIPIK